MPDGTSNAALLQAAIAPAILDPRAPRRDRATAKVVYQAQVLRRALGRRAAYTFMIAKRVPTALVLRVLSLPDQQLRR